MAKQYLKTLLTPSVLASQKQYFGRQTEIKNAPNRDPLTGDEQRFIESRDSFYMATVSEDDWPYVQHRGGRPGFMQVTSSTQLAFADYKGNRQMISTGNLAANKRVALFFMDYARRERLKLLGHARVEDARQHPELVEQFSAPEARQAVERLVFIDVLSFDWNCPKYITPRFTAVELEQTITPLHQRIAQLEAELELQKSVPN